MDRIKDTLIKFFEQTAHNISDFKSTYGIYEYTRDLLSFGVSEMYGRMDEYLHYLQLEKAPDANDDVGILGRMLILGRLKEHCSNKPELQARLGYLLKNWHNIEISDAEREWKTAKGIFLLFTEKSIRVRTKIATMELMLEKAKHDKVMRMVLIPLIAKTFYQSEKLRSPQAFYDKFALIP